MQQRSNDSSSDGKSSQKTFFCKWALNKILTQQVKPCRYLNEYSLFISFFRKNSYSINALVVCDHRKRIRYASFCNPGSFNDSGGLNRSPLHPWLGQNFNQQSPKYIMGDKAFGCGSTMIPRFRWVFLLSPISCTSFKLQKWPKMTSANDSQLLARFSWPWKWNGTFCSEC